jgi:hypothetical protein
MSEPKNPLDQFSTYQVRHILGAYKNTPSAESYNLVITSGKSGTSIAGGDGVVVANEFVDSVFSVPSVVWRWGKVGEYSATTTHMDGVIEIGDATGGRFLDWFRTNVIKTLGKSTDHLTFALKTYFIGVNRINETKDVITGNPLIFHVHHIRDIMNVKGEGTRVRLDFSAAYNATGQNPAVCKPYQLTLTHKSGNLTNTDPEEPNGSCSISDRGSEDASFFDPRKERLDKSKPMRTLKELFEAFEADLNQQPEAHKMQVQKWLSKIRDNYVQKITPPEQERGEKLPIEFEVKLDPIYYGYKVDNRNLPFEQTEERPDETKGVTSVPFRPGAPLTEMIETLMKYSIKVGEDAALPQNAKTFASNISYVVDRDDKIKIKIKIKQITIPYTTQDFGDTGPDKALKPLTFSFKSRTGVDNDITFLKTTISTDAGIIPLETPQTDSAKKPLVIFGNRETQTGERIPTSAPGDKFFDSGFSGLRLPIMPYLNTGLENAEAASNVDIMNFIKLNQRSDHQIEIRGNSSLMFDFHRLPSEAAELENPGEAEYYQIPESYPMYLKIDIFLRGDAVIGLDRDRGVPEQYFYKNHYEISGVINNLTDGAFYQTILLKKTDDII